MIVKKKQLKVSNESTVVDLSAPEQKTITEQLDFELTSAAESFGLNYKNFHSLIEGKVSADKLVDQLGEIGKDLAIQMEKSFSDENTRTEMVEFTKYNFNLIGETICEAMPSEKEIAIEDPYLDHMLLKIGINSGILSGFTGYVSTNGFNEK